MKKIIHFKKFSKLMAILILLSIIAFILSNQLFIRYRILNFIDINSKEIEKVKIIKKDYSLPLGNKYRKRKVNLKNDEEIKNLIDSLNEVKLKRDYYNETLYKLGQWVSYPETTSSITYLIFIDTRDKLIEIVLTSGNTYIDLNVRWIKNHIKDRQYYFKIVERYDEKLLKSLFN